MTQTHIALLYFIAGSLFFVVSTLPRVEADVWHRRWIQRCGAAMFILGSLQLW